MTYKKLFCYLFLLITFAIVPLNAVLDAQDNEQNNPAVQEFVKIAQNYIKQNKIDEAIDIYERIVNAAPNDIESQKQLANLYTRKNYHEKATQIWSELLNNDPVNSTYQDKLFDNTIASGKN